MTRKSFASVVAVLGSLAVLAANPAIFAAEPVADVLIYGATPAGIAAAIAAGQSGQNVVLVEPTARIGGLVTCGLSHSDFRTFEGLNGSFLKFTHRVVAHYSKHYGADSQQVRATFRGTFAEPKVNLEVFEAMLAECPSVVLRTQLVLDSVVITQAGDTEHVQSAQFNGNDGTKVALPARVFIDASYEGDLMAAAKVPWRAGRESQAEYDESIAPAEADSQLQAYNFRFCMTQDPANRVMPEAPAGYRREDFLPLLSILESGQIKKVFDYPSNCIFKAHQPPLPNGKYDINDVSGGLVRLSLPGQNLDWPNGDQQARAKIFAEHVRDQVGLLYFLQNDEAVPAKFQEEARLWGWCKDEFVESGHLPPQLYVREARRMIGVHVFNQRDSEHAEGDARAVLHRDAIAIGDYGNNCHGTFHAGPRFGGKHTGEFYNAVPPYQIPYGVLLPRAVDNLLVPVAASSSHVGFCALRLEPIWMSLGQAAGQAAVLANRGNIAVQRVSVSELQRILLADNAALIYVSDVSPGSADFVAVQWWGVHGGLHGLAPVPAKRGQRGKNIDGQYFEAFPGHAAELSKVLDADTLEQWLAIAGKLGLDGGKLPSLANQTTRGEFIHAAFSLAR